MKEPSQADPSRDYVAGLAAEGSGERLTFTLDAEAAREKLRAFQLPDPSYYLLLMVRSAVCRGATEVRIQVDVSAVRVSFDGPPFEQAELQEAHSLALSSPSGSAARSSKLLGLALGVLEGMGVDSVRVTSGSEEGGCRLEIKPGAPLSCTRIDGPVLGTRIEVARSNQPDAPESELVRERCRFAEIPIYLDGERISHGLALPDALGRVPIEEEAIRGEVAFGFASKYGPIYVVRDGVCIAELNDFQRGDGRVAVVEARELKTELSLFHVVKDEHHRALLETLRAAWRRAGENPDLKGLLQEATESEVAGRIAALKRLKTRRRIWVYLIAYLVLTPVIIPICYLYAKAQSLTGLTPIIIVGCVVSLMALLMVLSLVDSLFVDQWLRRRAQQLFPLASPLREVAAKALGEMGGNWTALLESRD